MTVLAFPPVEPWPTEMFDELGTHAVRQLIFDAKQWMASVSENNERAEAHVPGRARASTRGGDSSRG